MDIKNKTQNGQQQQEKALPKQMNDQYGII